MSGFLCQTALCMFHFTVSWKRCGHRSLRWPNINPHHSTKNTCAQPVWNRLKCIQSSQGRGTIHPRSGEQRQGVSSSSFPNSTSGRQSPYGTSGPPSSQWVTAGKMGHRKAFRTEATFAFLSLFFVFFFNHPRASTAPRSVWTQQFTGAREQLQGTKPESIWSQGLGPSCSLITGFKSWGFLLCIHTQYTLTHYITRNSIIHSRQCILQGNTHPHLRTKDMNLPWMDSSMMVNLLI